MDRKAWSRSQVRGIGSADSTLVKGLLSAEFGRPSNFAGLLIVVQIPSRSPLYREGRKSHRKSPHLPVSPSSLPCCTEAQGHIPLIFSSYCGNMAHHDPSRQGSGASGEGLVARLPRTARVFSCDHRGRRGFVPGNTADRPGPPAPRRLLLAVDKRRVHVPVPHSDEAGPRIDVDDAEGDELRGM